MLVDLDYLKKWHRVDDCIEGVDELLTTLLASAESEVERRLELPVSEWGTLSHDGVTVPERLKQVVCALAGYNYDNPGFSGDPQQLERYLASALLPFYEPLSLRENETRKTQ